MHVTFNLDVAYHLHMVYQKRVVFFLSAAHTQVSTATSIISNIQTLQLIPVTLPFTYLISRILYDSIQQQYYSLTKLPRSVEVSTVWLISHSICRIHMYSRHAPNKCCDVQVKELQFSYQFSLKIMTDAVCKQLDGANIPS